MKQFVIVKDDELAEQIKKWSILGLANNFKFYDNLVDALTNLDSLHLYDKEARVVEIGVTLTEPSSQTIKEALSERVLAILGQLSAEDQKVILRYGDFSSADIPEKPIRELTVQSEVERDVIYDVHEFKDGRWTCTCPAYNFNKNRVRDECKHIHLARLHVRPGGIHNNRVRYLVDRSND